MKKGGLGFRGFVSVRKKGRTVLVMFVNPFSGIQSVFGTRFSKRVQSGGYLLCSCFINWCGEFAVIV